MYAFTYETPGTPELYAAVFGRIGNAEPTGLIVRLATAGPSGVRHTMVWASESDWVRFRTAHIEPAVSSTLEANGMTAPQGFPPVEILDLVDVEAPLAVPAAATR